MRFAATTLLAIAAGASAAVLPRSKMGSWTAQVTQRDDGYQHVHFEFTSDAYPEVQRSTCLYDPTQTPVYKRCDKASVDFEYRDETLKISQGIQLPYPMTVFGESKLVLDQITNAGHLGETTVEVIKAIA